jgi:hypothetical protein
MTPTGSYSASRARTWSASAVCSSSKRARAWRRWARASSAAERPQHHAELPQALGLAVRGTQLPVQVQALPQAGQRLLVAALPLVDLAEVAEAGGLAAAEGDLPTRCPIPEM